MSTVIVTGATGLLGRQVTKAFRHAGWEVHAVGYSRAEPPEVLKLDLNSEEEVSKLLCSIRPQTVVHCAANRFPDKCESDSQGTVALNITASSRLASLCAELGILMIYISTDYVFSGKPGEAPYEIDSIPNPPNFYGKTKLGGEQAVLSAFEKVDKKGWGVVLRVPVLYGQAHSNKESAINVLMDQVWEAMEKDQRVQMDDWAIRYPTNTEDVARVCQDIAAKYLSVHDKSTLPVILHFSSEDRFTKYEICRLFAERSGLTHDILEAVSQGNDPTSSVQRPYDCHLSVKALKDLGIDTSTQDFEGWWRREARAFRK